MVSAPTWSYSSSTRERRPPPLAFRNTSWGCDEDDGLHEPAPLLHRSASVSNSKTSTNADGCVYPRKGSIATLSDIREVTYRSMSMRAESLGLDAPDRDDVYKYADKELPLPPPSAGKVRAASGKHGRTLDVRSDCSMFFDPRNNHDDFWIEEARSAKREHRSRTHTDSPRKTPADSFRRNGSCTERQPDGSVARKAALSKSSASKELNLGSFADRMRVGHMIVDHIVRRKPKGFFRHYTESATVENDDDHLSRK